MRKGQLFVSVAVAALSGGAASADEVPVGVADGLTPLSVSFGSFTAQVDGEASTVGLAAHQPQDPVGGFGTKLTDVAGMATLKGAVTYAVNPGWSLELRANLFLRSDSHLSDDYGNNVFQTVYGRLETPYGAVEMGVADGAAAALAVGAPVVDRDTSLCNPHVGFFRETSDVFINTLAIKSTIRTTLNYGKLSYSSPRLYGFQIGVSYTPAPNRDAIPFLNRGKKIADLNVSYWEGALNYSETFGNVETSAYLGGAFADDPNGRAETNHLGLTDWAFGGRVSYAVDAATKISLGGGFHRKNSYLFTIADGVLEKYQITSLHLSAMLEHGRWSAGIEYGDGAYKGTDVNYYMMAMAADPHVGNRAYGAALHYAVTPNLGITAGWQEHHYSRDPGAFYNDNPKATMQAVFLKATLAIP